MRYPFGPVCAAAPFLLAAASAAADVVITTENTKLADNRITTTTMSLAADRMRIDLGTRVILFRGDQSKVYMLDTANHTYLDIGALHQQSDAMQQRLANLPEAQRKQVEAMMAAHGAPAAQPASEPPKVTYEKAGSATVGTWSCTVYHQTQNGKHIADSCIAPLGSVGITASDVASLRSFGETMRKAVGGAQAPQSDASARFDLDAQTAGIGFPGLPVETTTYTDDKPVSKIDFKTVEHRDLPADLFEIPAGYKQTQMGQ